MIRFWLNILEKVKETKTYDTEWAKKLCPYELNIRSLEKELYYELIHIIRKTADGAFDIESAATCRNSRGLAIVQKRELPWDYLYECMKLSQKDFCILLPNEMFDELIKHIEKDRKTVYAWYDTETDSIRTFAYTGNLEEEENTYPAYDGYGRYDTYYEIVEGYLSKDGKWLKEPKRRFVSLTSM